jgi:hypothetical protein
MVGKQIGPAGSGASLLRSHRLAADYSPPPPKKRPLSTSKVVAVFPF